MDQKFLGRAIALPLIREITNLWHREARALKRPQ